MSYPPAPCNVDFENVLQEYHNMHNERLSHYQNDPVKEVSTRASDEDRIDFKSRLLADVLKRGATFLDNIEFMAARIDADWEVLTNCNDDSVTNMFDTFLSNQKGLEKMSKKNKYRRALKTALMTTKCGLVRQNNALDYFQLLCIEFQFICA